MNREKREWEKRFDKTWLQHDDAADLLCRIVEDYHALGKADGHYEAQCVEYMEAVTTRLDIRI